MATDPFDLNLRHLRALLAIREHGSITAAADVVSLSQPALTQGLELALAFESASAAHRDMVRDLRWSETDAHAHVLRDITSRSAIHALPFPLL